MLFLLPPPHLKRVNLFHRNHDATGRGSGRTSENAHLPGTPVNSAAARKACRPVRRVACLASTLRPRLHRAIMYCNRTATGVGRSDTQQETAVTQQRDFGLL